MGCYLPWNMANKKKERKQTTKRWCHILWFDSSVKEPFYVASSFDGFEDTALFHVIR